MLATNFVARVVVVFVAELVAVAMAAATAPAEPSADSVEISLAAVPTHTLASFAVPTTRIAGALLRLDLLAAPPAPPALPLLADRLLALLAPLLVVHLLARVWTSPPAVSLTSN